jgi:WhiB family redox-sensing transcriptional regulator
MAAETARAKAVCARCPVAADCLAYAEKTHVQFGIWGGLTENDRRKLRKQRRQQEQERAA